MVALDVCRNAASARIDLTFLATGGGDLESDFAASGVDYVRLQRRLPVDPMLVLRLRQIIKNRDVRVVHAQQAVEAIHLYLATRGMGVKCVMSLHNYILDTKNRLATKFIVPRMDAVCPVSVSMQEWFRTAEGFRVTEKFHIIHNGVDPSRLAPTRPAGSVTLRDELGLGARHKLIAMVGNFYPDERKDQLTVCRALPSVMGQLPSAHFVFVGAVHKGAEAYRERCAAVCRENGLAGRVHFVGKRGDIPDVLRELDLFVFSSVQEGLPVAAIEALMLGVPMLVSDIPPLLEVVGADTADGACAATFRTGDAEDLSAKLIDLFDNKDRLKELGEKARSQTPKRFGITANLQNLHRLYEQLTTDD